MTSALQYQEIYNIADFQQNYVALVVCIYQNSQFYILFNQREYFSKTEEDNQWNNRQIRKFLQNLIKKAEKELDIKITELSYNLPSDEMKIVKHSYIHQFSSSTKIDRMALKTIHQGFVTGINKDKNYKNSLFKITNYHLIDQNKKQTSPPLDEITESIKIEGYLYQVHWKTLLKYSSILKNLKLKKTTQILLPHAIYVSLLSAQTSENLVIILWNKTEWKSYYFGEKILLHHFSLQKNLNYFIKKISQKFQYGEKDVENYLFQLLDLNPTLNHSLDTYLEIHNPQLMRLTKETKNLTEKYLLHVIDEMFFVLKEKLNLDLKILDFYLVGDITEITNLKGYLKSKSQFSRWKINQNHFMGLIDYRDSFLIGNAYQQHLENKLLYNQKER